MSSDQEIANTFDESQEDTTDNCDAAGQGEHANIAVSLEPPLPSQNTLNLSKSLYHPAADVIWLSISVTIFVAAILLQHNMGRIVSFPFGGNTLPELCGSQRYFQIDCPGCGLTRSFIHMAHGSWLDAWNIQPVGVFGFLFVLAQIPFRIWSLIAGYHENQIKRVINLRPLSTAMLREQHLRSWATSIGNVVLLSLVTALMARWLLRLFTGDLLP